MRHNIKLFGAAIAAVCVLGCKAPKTAIKTTTDLYGRELRQYVQLSLSDQSGRKDEIIIGLKDGALLNFDIDEDGLYNHLNTGLGLSSMSGDGVPLTTNIIPFPGLQPEVIRLGISAGQDSDLKMEVTEMTGLPDHLKIKLVDRFENVSSACCRKMTYAFNSGKGHNSRADAGRFILVIYNEQYYSFSQDHFYEYGNGRERMASALVRQGSKDSFLKL